MFPFYVAEFFPSYGIANLHWLGIKTLECSYSYSELIAWVNNVLQLALSFLTFKLNVRHVVYIFSP